MKTLRRAADRGNVDHGWLKTSHTFSFADYRHPEHHHFQALRVINEDVVAPNSGFGMHAHQDMEIVTHVLSGALEHQDSLGNRGVLRAGEWQRMSAGTGVLHSEFNPDPKEPVHFYQIWLFPDRKGLPPSYEQKKFAADERHNRLRVAGSPSAREGSFRIHQDVGLYLATLDAGVNVQHELKPGRHAWLQVLRGSVQVCEHSLVSGDGLAVSEEAALELIAKSAAEVMLFDLAPLG